MKLFPVLIVVAVVLGQVISSEEDEEMEETLKFLKNIYCNENMAEIKDYLVECIKVYEDSMHTDVTLECHPDWEEYKLETAIQYICETDDEELLKTAKCEQDSLMKSEKKEEILAAAELTMACFKKKMDAMEEQGSNSK
ncbi:uncharacterized protein LOC129226155 [Uloborus diversus]|uniref:uncharacterized protein LOC129226136 n=1 Tax=Uloborus diversus TaxID=327109 RepID=UPI00240A4483|nr:uncharacterized protein LOC129226136 [Uloborus diversus]XP_054716734.1 uncharacterized protein LOC129226155 [Uloborus diversus]